MSSQPGPQGSVPGMVPVEVVLPRTYTPPRRRSILGILFTLFLLVGLGGSLLLNGVFLATRGTDARGKVREKFVSHSQTGTQKVAILSINGVILDGEGFVKQAIDRAMKDENLKAIVLRVDSPGGTINGADYIYHHLLQLTAKKKIPIVVSMGGMAASGGYYVSMVVGDTPDTIYAEPTTWTGSIGVIIPHYNIVDLMKQWGIKDDSVVSHPLKDLLSISRTMSESERQLVQALVDDAFTRFKDIVKSGRPAFEKDPAALDKVATGQIFSAEQARAAGLVDRIGFVEDAIDRAIELAKLNKDDVRVVKYEPEPTLADVLFGAQARSPRINLMRGMDLSDLLSLASPRAYYLCSWLPSAAE